MTQEAKIVFGLEDISKICVLCRKCGGEVAIPLKKNALKRDYGIPESQCPYCGTPWNVTGRLAEFELVFDMRALAGRKEENSPSPVELRFEMDAPRP